MGVGIGPKTDIAVPIPIAVELSKSAIVNNHPESILQLTSGRIIVVTAREKILCGDLEM